jgi:hypothetical protein
MEAVIFPENGSKKIYRNSMERKLFENFFPFVANFGIEFKINGEFENL